MEALAGRMIWPALIAFCIGTAIAPFVIPFLRKLKFGQTEREDGVQAHLKKAGTPTIGGVIFLSGTTVAALLSAPANPEVIPVLFLTLGFGVIGFLDDFLKVVLRRSDGLLPYQKMALQIVVTAVFCFYLIRYTDVSLTLQIPFMKGYCLDIGVLAIPLMFFAVIGTVNGTNFTDGLDGLASSVTVVVCIFFTAAACAKGMYGLVPMPCAMLGGLLAFLLFNCYPAQIFMGDTGSLALGGFAAGCAYMLQMPIFLIIVGMIYMVEVISVIIQVGYFKLTHGKRFFKMAPIHHHFELCGWSETRIVYVFTIITAILSMIGFMAM